MAQEERNALTAHVRKIKLEIALTVLIKSLQCFVSEGWAARCTLLWAAFCAEATRISGCTVAVLTHGEFAGDMKRARTGPCCSSSGIA